LGLIDDVSSNAIFWKYSLHQSKRLPGAVLCASGDGALSMYIELPAKILDYFLRSNKSNINQMGGEGGFVFTNRKVEGTKNAAAKTPWNLMIWCFLPKAFLLGILRSLGPRTSTPWRMR